MLSVASILTVFLVHHAHQCVCSYLGSTLYMHHLTPSESRVSVSSPMVIWGSRRCPIGATRFPEPVAGVGLEVQGRDIMKHQRCRTQLDASGTRSCQTAPSLQSCIESQSDVFRSDTKQPRSPSRRGPGCCHFYWSARSSGPRLAA